MSYALVLALGLLFLAVSFLLTHQVSRIAAVVLAAVLFLLAAIIDVFGTGGG